MPELRPLPHMPYNAADMDSTATAKTPGRHEFDPESFRMSLGDHLEELRWRLIIGLVGFVVAAAVCLYFGEHVVSIFCKPLIQGLRKYDLNTQIYFTHLTDTFTTYMEISLISAAAIASPWLLYQIWQFVRTGLYQKERKYVTKYIPYSVGLLIAGMLFMYFVVLPITINFLLYFSQGFPLKGIPSQIDTAIVDRHPTTLPIYHGDPAKPVENEIWIDAVQNRLKIRMHNETRIIQFGSQSMISPLITLPTYIDLVVQLLLLFGLTFQLPLVMLALVRIGILEIATLRKFRRVAYFIIAVICGFVVPDVVTGMIAMMIPLIVLYEAGIILAVRTTKPAEAAEEASTDAES